MHKVLDHGFIKVLDLIGSEDTIVESARVSTGSKNKTKEQNAKLIHYLIKNGHTSPLEMALMRLHIKLPIFVMRQLVRHRTASINEKSLRYSIHDTSYYIPKKLHKQGSTNKQCSGEELSESDRDIWNKQFIFISEEALGVYNAMIDCGIAREEARIVLPVNFYTEIIWMMDVNNLLKFLTQRCSTHAQHEIREYAHTIKEDILKPWLPNVYDAFIAKI